MRKNKNKLVQVNLQLNCGGCQIGIENSAIVEI